MRILERIAARALATPDHLVHRSGDQSLTYGDLWYRSERLAALLTADLPADGRPIAVRGHKEPAMLIAFLAAVKAGHPYIPIDRSMPEERAQRIITASDALVLEAEALPEVPSDLQAPPPARWVQGEQPFYIIYTSGSTGEPKGVQVSADCLESFVAWMLSEQPIREAEEVFLNQAPFSFDLSVMDLYLALATGSTLFSLEKATFENPRRLFPALVESGITAWVSTPSFAMICLAEQSFTSEMLPSLQRFLFCGERLPADCAARLLERFPSAEVWNTYGPTEATVATTSVRITREILDRYNPLPVGRPKPDARILLMQEGQPVPEGERGEIVIAGPNVALGYLNNPAQTERAFFRLDGQRAYRTGDWGRYQDGLLFWEGRIDFQVKLHGYRIELGDIETHLRALPGVVDAVVLPALKEGRTEWLAAFVILSDRGEQSDFALGQTLRQELSTRLPAYMLPRKCFFLEYFPMTSNGKVDRRMLMERLG